MSTLAVVGNLLYIGTCWGCLVVAETSGLRPVTVFRPYRYLIIIIASIIFKVVFIIIMHCFILFINSEEIEALVSLAPRDGPQCLVSIGRGYRNLIGEQDDRYDGKDEDDENIPGPSALAGVTET